MASEVIKLNIIPTGDMPVFHCSQFDNGRLINIELYRGEDAYTIPEGCTAELHCRKVDGNIVTIGSPVVDENTVKFTSTTQLTACNGKNLCEVAILGADDYLIGSLNFWLEVEVDPLKGGINSTSEIHDLYEQIEDITAEVIGDDYYNKTEVDNLLDDKADKSTTYTKTQVDTLLTAKADKSNVYTKSETNTLLSAKADADNVYTKAQVETKLAAKADAASVYTKDETDALLDTKANANAVYTKVEVDAMVDDIEDAIDLKADAATTYTKTEVDTALALKANAATTYTKTEVDTALALKANAADVYTKAETDAAIEAAIDDILPVDTAGPSAIANFTTGLALPLVECEVGIVATGGNGTPDSPIPISGYTEANITRCGVNLWDGTQTILTNASLSDGVYSNTNTDTKTVFNLRIAAYNNNTKTQDLVTSEINQTGVKSYTFNFPSGSNNLRIWHNGLQRDIRIQFPFAISGTYTLSINIIGYNPSTIGGLSFDNVQLELGSTATTYHAYNGTTVTIAFGQTVYGGTLDVTRGKLSATWGSAAIGDLSWALASGASSPSGKIFRTYDVLTKPRERYTPNTVMCDIFSSDTNWWFTSNVENYGMMVNNDGRVYIRDDDYDNDIEGFVTALGSTFITYELATPIEIDLTPVQIRALVGENNVFGDTNGDSTVKFKDTIQNYIDKKVIT